MDLQVSDLTDCPDENGLLEFAQRGPGDLVSRTVELHLDQCSPCRRVLALLAQVGSSPQSTPAESISAEVSMPAGVEPSSFRPGEAIGRYLVEERLGAGAMGVVYRAHDPELDRKVAVKLIRGELTPGLRGDHFRERLSREAKAMARLDHRNVVAVHELGSARGLLYVAMDYVEGGTLRQWLAEAERSVDEILEVYLAAGRGLSAAHSAGLVHRDFKPDNVLVGKDGRARVTDFGLVRAVVPEASPPVAGAPELCVIEPLASPSRASITHADTIVGTPAYMAPEQIDSLAIDARADLFSFCAALYEALYGQRPFAGKSVQQLRRAIEEQALAAPHKSGRVPAWLRRVLLRGLRARPDERYPSMDELLAALSKDRRRLFRFVALAGAILVVGGAAFLVGSRAARPAPMLRPSEKLVAVLELQNRAGQADAAWLSTAVGELVSAELHAGGGLRIAPGDEVSRMQRELRLTAAEELPAAALAQIHQDLRADLVVSGSYLQRAGGKLELRLQIVEAASGRTLTSSKVSGPQESLFALASRAGLQLRSGLGIEALTKDQEQLTQASLPRQLDAARAYARGLLRFRNGDAQAARRDAEEAVRLAPEHAFSHLLLARSLKVLGYYPAATAEGRLALQAADKLDREDQLAIELITHDLAAEWERAIEVGQALVTFYPGRTDYALSLARVLSRARRGKECLEAVEALRRRSPGSDGDPNVDHAEARCAESAADFARGLSAAERAMKEARQRGARLLAASAQLLVAQFHGALGKPDLALEQYAEVAATGAELDDKCLQGAALNGQGMILTVRQDLLRARPVLEKARELLHGIGYRNGEMYAVNNLANAWFADAARSRQLYAEAAGIAREVNDPFGLALTQANLGIADANAGLIRTGRTELEEARGFAHQIGDRSREALVLVNLCVILVRVDDFAAAHAACDEGEKLLLATGEKFNLALLDQARATLLLEEGKLVDAERVARAALERARGLGVPAIDALLRAALAEALGRRGRVADANLQLQAARALGQSQSAVELAAGRVGLQSRRRRDCDAAVGAFTAASAAAKASGSVCDDRDARLGLGEALHNCRGPGGRALLQALSAEAAAAGDQLVVRKVAALQRLAMR